MVQKFVVSFIFLISISTQAWAQLCRLSPRSLAHRRQFIEDVNKKHHAHLREMRQWSRDASKVLSDMKDAHIASDVAQSISAVAGIVAGGAAISTLYFAGGSVSAMGITIQSGTMGAHLYSTYSIGSNVATLAQVGYNIWSRNETPEEVLEDQRRKLDGKQIFSKDALKFLVQPGWSGHSDSLESPLITKAFQDLEKFYEDQKRKIGDSDSWWGYVGEFWHERGLKTAALHDAVFKEGIRLQKLRIAYFDNLKALLDQHFNQCY